MRSALRANPFSPRGARRAFPLEPYSRTEKVIAFCRALLATATFAVVVADAKEPSVGTELAVIVLLTYIVYSGLLFLVVRGEYIPQERLGRVALVADILWVTAIILVTEGSTSPFFLLHAFVILSVSLRWGLQATMGVTAVLAVLYPFSLWVESEWLGPNVFIFRRAYLFRPFYLLGLGCLIGYIGEYERRSKRKLGFLLELPALFRRDRPPGRGLARLMRRALDEFTAERAILTLRDPDSGRYVTWELRRQDGRTRLGLRITDTDPLPLSFARGSEGFLANDLRPGLASALCYDLLTGAVERRALAPPLPVVDGERVQAALATPVLIQHELRGHAVVLRETWRKFTRDDLEFLILLAGQAASGFENIRLSHKAEEVAVLEERGRIARDLHDGFIQSLAGIDLRLEACKVLLQRDPGRVPRALADLHQAVDRGYKEVRHYLNVLRAPRLPAADVWSQLESLARDFSSRERLRVHLTRPPHDPVLSSRAGYELTQIVREALHNAVRHGRATQAIVKIAARPSHLYLLVRDNGTGFVHANGSVDGDGFLAPQAAPWSIRERTEGLGGTLSVWTQPGCGAEVIVTIPTPGRTARPSTDRRMHA